MDVSSDDDGISTCVAMNDMGRAEGTVSLEVQGNQILHFIVIVHALFLSLVSHSNFVCCFLVNKKPPEMKSFRH